MVLTATAYLPPLSNQAIWLDSRKKLANCTPEPEVGK